MASAESTSALGAARRAVIRAAPFFFCTRSTREVVSSTTCVLQPGALFVLSPMNETRLFGASFGAIDRLSAKKARRRPAIFCEVASERARTALAAQNRDYATSLTVRARWGRIRFRDAAQETSYQKHVLDEDMRLSIRFLRYFFFAFAFGAIAFTAADGIWGRLSPEYREVRAILSAAARAHPCARARPPPAAAARAAREHHY